MRNAARLAEGRATQEKGQTETKESAGSQDLCNLESQTETKILHKERNAMDQRIVGGSGVWTRDVQEEDRWHLKRMRFAARSSTVAG